MAIWKDIEGYEGIYQISDEGAIKILSRGIIKKQSITKRGYCVTTLSKNNKAFTKYIHRLVACAFIENPERKEQVNHIDGNKSNNNRSNLEWCTNQENREHGVKNGLINFKLIAEASAKVTSKPVTQIDPQTGVILNKYMSINKAALALSIDASSITKVCKGKLKHCGGYIWAYAAA